MWSHSHHARTESSAHADLQESLSGGTATLIVTLRTRLDSNLHRPSRHRPSRHRPSRHAPRVASAWQLPRATLSPLQDHACHTVTMPLHNSRPHVTSLCHVTSSRRGHVTFPPLRRQTLRKRTSRSPSGLCDSRTRYTQ